MIAGYHKWFAGAASLLTALLFCSCSEETEQGGAVTVQLAMNVSATRMSDTRMSGTVTQVDGATARAVSDFWIIPYNVKRKIEAEDQPLLGQVGGLGNVATTGTQYHYYGNSYEALRGTASFLCYGRATSAGDAAINGSVTTPDLSSRIPTSDIYFAPTPIYNHNNVAHATAIAIADALTSVATAGDWNTSTDRNWQTLFEMFTNGGELIPGSSASVTAYLEALRTAVNTQTDGALKIAILTAISDATSTAPASALASATANGGFPAIIGLPDGAAVLRWTGTRFEPQTQATTLASMVSQNRFAYPAELYFYANSKIKTSNSEVASSAYSGKTWEQVLSLYENPANVTTGTAVVNGNTRAVAIIEPLRYGVGSLKATVRTESRSLADADGTAISFEETSFPLTGLLISGQYRQGFDFTPLSGELDEYVLYDSQFSGVYLDPTATPTSFSTLTFQTREGEKVRLALEFKNNSGQTFRGVNGHIYPGTKFYLIGELEPKAIPTDDYERQVFTQSYITQVDMKVSGLEKAYNVVPDLLSSRLEVGMQLVTGWIEATQTVVRLK